MKKINELKDREKQILSLLCKNKSNKQIGNEIGLSEKSVKYYLTSIYKKLGVTSRYSALFYCLKANFLKKKDID